MRRSITPNGQAGTQYPQPLQMSSCTTTVPNSVRNSDPVGQTSRQAACVQCLHTSEAISQRSPPDPGSSWVPVPAPVATPVVVVPVAAPAAGPVAGPGPVAGSEP